MCGIAGFCNMPRNWRDNIERMNRRMLHRGPDGGGVWCNESSNTVLGHRRLSILDMSEAGKQPMLSHSGRFVIVFNGEIYNFSELKKILISNCGVSVFRGHSDTEILLEFIENYGLDAALKKAKGMFAMAVYDRQEKKLMLARDRMGEKPLYYGFCKGGFIFASEISAVAEHEDFEANIDREALALYFRHGYIPAPFSIYGNVKKLDAGCILEISEPFEDILIRKYWDIEEVAERVNDNPFIGTIEEATDRLDQLLTDAIRLQMVADVPVGAFLSGGIDSTTVVALMQKVSTTPIKTFSIGFGEESYNEAKYAKETAQYLGTDHTELYVTDDDALDIIPSIAKVYGEPFADSSQIPTFLVSRLAKSKVTVSLSGDGGDELFGGYGSYMKVDNIWNHISQIPLPLRRFIREGTKLFDMNHKIHLIRHYINSSNPIELYTKLRNVMECTDSIVNKTIIPNYKMSDYTQGNFYTDCRDKIMLTDLLVYHPDDILVKVDRSGMAVSLESRIPMLDRDVVEFALSLPIEYKIHNGIQKVILKDVLYRYIPREMMERPKKGFSMPVNEWCRKGKLRGWMEDSLSKDRIKSEDILDWSVVKKLKSEFINTGRCADKIWYLCIFEQWLNSIHDKKEIEL